MGHEFLLLTFSDPLYHPVHQAAIGYRSPTTWALVVFNVNRYSMNSPLGNGTNVIVLYMSRGLSPLHAPWGGWPRGAPQKTPAPRASAPTMTKALLLGGTLLVLAERRQCQSSALCCTLPLPGVRQWRRHVGLCRVSFSVVSWVFVFVKAYFYVSTSTMVSQCVLRLNYKTPAGLALWLLCAARLVMTIFGFDAQQWASSHYCL